MITYENGSVLLTKEDYDTLIIAMRNDYHNQLKANPTQVCDCPLCGRNNSTYVRKINLGQVLFMKVMFDLYRKERIIWHRYDDVQRLVEGLYKKKCTDYSKLVSIGLLVPKNEYSEDKNSSGFFSLTKKACLWLDGSTTIPESTIQTSEGHILSYSDKLITINDFMKKPANFKYNELLGLLNDVTI
jgi:hypothetical protein